MTVTLRRTAEQQRDLEQLLAAQQNPASADYHKWLTPEEFADRFGASHGDLERMREWLENQGFHIQAVAHGRTFVRFDGTAEQVRKAFGMSHPALPAELIPLVLRVGGLGGFAPHPHYAYSGGSLNALAPADLAAIYDISGSNGTGQTVVVIGSSDILSADLALYCSTLSADPACGTALTVVLPDGDPGTDAIWAGEETMDLELVSAVAPGAALVLDLDASVWNALYDAVDNNRGQIISMNFGICENLADASLAAALESAVEQANAQGITVIASSGDSGAAGCDSGSISGGAHGPAVQLPAALPEVTAVGGTTLDEGSGAYWDGGGTATGYIPEVVWNDTIATSSFAASGGGASTLFAKPAWQAGTGVPADGQRDVPDIALAASAIHDGYVVAIGGALSTDGDSPYTMGGTSAAAAVFAGMVALVNESQSSASGNINPALYAIAAGSGGAMAFHDIATGNNKVACASIAAGCSGSPPQTGWDAATGYDLASGLGSVDEAQLLAAWPAGYNTTPTIATLAPSSAGAGSPTQSVTITGTGFTALSTVTWTASAQTSVLTSSCASSVSCSTTVPASLLTSPGTATVRVVGANGLTSAPATFTVASVPTISSLSTTNADAGSAPFLLTVTGTNFVASSTVMWNATALSTTFVSPTSLTASVTSAQLAIAGAQTVTVRNETGTSTGVTFTVNGPSITLLSPSSAAAGSAGFSLTVTGAGFAGGSTVMWGSTALATTPTTPGSTTSLTATVTAAQLAAAGPQNVAVQNAYGVSPASMFAVDSPTITLLSPNSAVAGSLSGGATLTMTVTGTNFVSSSTVYWGPTPLATTYTNPTSLTAQVTSAQLAASGSGSVTVQNGSAAAASTVSAFTVAGPNITSLSPNSAVAGSITGNATLAVTVSGTNFVNGSTVYWGATPLATTFTNATSLTAQVTSTQLAPAGPASVTIQNGSAAAVSAASTFTVSGPTVVSLNPTSAAAGANPLILTVTGTNFIAGSSVYWGSTPLATTYINAASLTAQVTGTQLASAGPVNITVQNGGASSNASAFTVNAPGIASLSLNSIPAGTAGNTMVTINGTNFISVTLDGGGNWVSGSLVYAGATALAVTAGNATSLTAAIPPSLVAAAGRLSLTVHNPGGATSSASTVTVVGPMITSLSPTSAVAGGAAFTLTVTGTNFVNPGSTVMWGGVALATTYVSATTLTAAVTSNRLMAAGPQSVTVQNSTSASSSASTFTVNGPLITSVSPGSLAAGTAIATAVTLTGANFIPVTLDGSGNYASGSLVYAGATLLPVTAGTSTSITAIVPVRLLASAGALSLTVQNPGGAASAAAAFTVIGPVISSLTPNSAVAGSAGFSLIVGGANFISGSRVMWNGTPLTTNPTVPGSTTSLTANVSSSQLLSSGVQLITVANASTATSAASSFTVSGPAITSLGPPSASAGSASFALIVTGMNFVSGSTVLWNGTALVTTPTTPGSTTSLTATVASGQLAAAGSEHVTVKNSSSASSSASTFAVLSPTIESLSPTSAAAGGGSFPLIVTGSNFVAGSTVYWGTTPLATTPTIPGSTTSLTATVTSVQLNSVGSQKITVHNSSAAASAATNFIVIGPTISSLSLASIPAGAGATTITVNGSDFITVTLDGSGNYVSGSLVYAGNTALTVTAGATTSLTAVIPARLLASTGKLSLTVHNPGGATSAAATVTITGPTIASLGPASAVAGSAPFSLTVTGANFVAGSSVMWGGTPLATSFTSTTSLTASVTSAQLTAAGSPKITVKNSSTASSAAATFTVCGPTITALSPVSIAAGSAPFQLTVTGINFVNGSTVMWGTTPLATAPTMAGSTTSLTANVTSAQLVSAGSPKITVQNATGAKSAGATFTVYGPTLTSLSSTSASAGDVSFSLTVTGTNFVAGSQVLWNSTALATVFNSGTSLTATVATAQLNSAGSMRITVRNSSGSASAASTFTVKAPTLTSLSPTSAVVHAASFPLTVTGTNFVADSKVLWNSTALAVTSSSPTSLTATVTSAQLASAGSAKITVQNSSSASSASRTFTVTSH